MRQATGSNTPQSGIKVSIQLSLDGHSFSVPALSELPAGEAPVTVELLLPRTMLVPGELFDAERGAEMLAANGMPPTAEECVVASDPEAEFVAVTAINREALRQVDVPNYRALILRKTFPQLRELIDGEDKAHPLSDEKLRCLLEQKGCVLSRRTVAKYREELGIPGTAGRRE